ncbi:MAG TPA: O-antigen ligase family protein [Thermoguttaceae bacterium]|nr:O-antigen ligase family protein [Thermoguttaceae bacterium]
MIWPKTTGAWSAAWDVRPIAWLMVALTAVAGAGILFAPRPLLILGAALAAMLITVLAAWPNTATLVVIGILYSNAAVVAVTFHGVPYLIGASVSLLLAVPLIHYVVLRRERLIIGPVLPLIGVFLVIQLFSATFSKNPAFSLGKLGVSVVEGLCLYFLVINVIRTPAMLRRVTWVLLGVGAFLGGLSTLQQITKTYQCQYAGFAQMSESSFQTDQATAHGQLRQRRLAGPIGDQNRYAQIMLMLVPLGLFRFWSERSRKLRIAALAATVLTLAGVALTFSRGAAVAFALLLAIMVFLRYVSLKQLGIILLGIVLVFCALPQYGSRLTSLGVFGSALQREGPGIAKADSSIRSRYTEAMAAGLIFADHPLTGVGPGMYPAHYHEYAKKVGLNVKESSRQSHTLFLGIAAELGAPGILAFLAIVGVALWNLARARRRCLRGRPDLAHLVTGFMLAIVAYLAVGFFLHFAYVRYFWLMLALAGAACYAARVADVGSKGATAAARP